MDSPRPRQLLFVASTSGEGQFRHLLDPELVRRLAARGFQCHGCFLSQLRESHLQECHCLVLMRTPMPGHGQDDSPLFRQWIPSILHRVAQGMGLMIFFSESYGRSEGTLAELLAPLEAQCVFNEIREENPLRQGRIPNLDGGDTVLAQCFVPGIPALEVVVGGGHGTQQLTCQSLSAAWVPLLQGAESCVSVPFPQGNYAHGGSGIVRAPVFAAIRSYGAGRVVLFPASAPLWLSSGYLERFQGYLLEQREGAGLAFLLALWERAASEKAQVEPAKSLCSLSSEGEGERRFSFRCVSEEEQSRLHCHQPFRMFLGSMPAGMTREEFCRRSVAAGVEILVLWEDYASLTQEGWKVFREWCGRQRALVVEPGYEQVDEEGNASVVFSVEDLPEQRLRYPHSNLLEDLLVKRNGYAAVYARTGKNRYPLWRQGGYNLVEYTGESSLGEYLRRVGSVSALSPVTVNRGKDPARERWHTYVLAPSVKEWRKGVTENRHRTFVATGSCRLLDFGLYGPGLMDDDWEGYWYEWDEGETATLEISLESNSPFQWIVVKNGTQEFRRYGGGERVFRHRETLVLHEDLRLTLSAQCADGSRLIASYPLYTRNRHFWAHLGSDQMNDYHNVFQEEERGMLGIGRRFYEPYGFVTCGFAWGDYVRLTSSVPWSSLMPSGIEVSSMTANFKSFHPSPLAFLSGGRWDYLNDQERWLGRCTADVHRLHCLCRGSWQERPGAVWRGHGGRRFLPTWATQKSRLWWLEGELEIPRWLPRSSVEVRFHLVLHFLRGHVVPKEGLVVAQSLHLFKPGLRLQGAPLEDLLQPGMSPLPEGKEWDIQNSPFLLRKASCGPSLVFKEALEITGDPCGVYRFHPSPEMAGSWRVLAWRWGEEGFLLAYAWQGRRSFSPGESLSLEYRISLEPTR